MNINEPRMLPPLLLQMEDMRDLLQAEECVIEEVRRYVADQALQLTICTATSGLSRHEEIMGMPVDTGALIEDRRSRIIAKLLGQGTVNKTLLENVAASFTNGEVEVIEHPEQFSFDVRFISVLGTPSNMEDLTAALDEIKPAHLVYQYLYRYLLIREIHDVMSLQELEEQTLDKFAF